MSKLSRLSVLPNVSSRLNLSIPSVGLLTLATAVAGIFLFPIAAFAHHPLDGATPQNFIQGFLSGLGHPILGIDHFAFVIASGLLAAIFSRGILIPCAFVLTGLVGTGIHLLSWDLAAPELIISASVLIFGLFLVQKHRPSLEVITLLAAIAGLFHGYAYGESIIGAEITPLLAYLLGFTLIQLAIALIAYVVGKKILQTAQNPARPFRIAGFILCGVGIAFVSSAIVG